MVDEDSHFEGQIGHIEAAGLDCKSKLSQVVPGEGLLVNVQPRVSLEKVPLGQEEAAAVIAAVLSLPREEQAERIVVEEEVVVTQMPRVHLGDVGLAVDRNQVVVVVQPRAGVELPDGRRVFAVTRTHSLEELAERSQVFAASHAYLYLPEEVFVELGAPLEVSPVTRNVHPSQPEDLGIERAQHLDISEN
jgi:hypothetical protein